MARKTAAAGKAEKLDAGFAAKVAEMRASGKTVKEIAKELHVRDRKVSAALAPQPKAKAKPGRCSCGGKCACGKKGEGFVPLLRVMVQFACDDGRVLVVESDSVGEAFAEARKGAEARLAAIESENASRRAELRARLRSMLKALED